MFDKVKFAEIIEKVSETYNNQRDFSALSEINRTYLSQYKNKKLDKPPKPEILSKLANASNGITTYTELMILCGYYKSPNDRMKNYIYDVFKKVSNYSNDIDSIKMLINIFIDYLNNLIDSFLYKDGSIVNNAIYYLKFDKKIFPYFMILHDSLVKYLISLDLAFININYIFIDWLNTNELYNNSCDLLSYGSKYINISDDSNYQYFIDILKEYGIYLNYFFKSYFEENNIINNITKKQIHMCPVYGQISAGTPNWAEECIEGRIPIDPSLMDIVDPEECYFLRVNGESMNKVIRNGAYALIRKQDIVNDGEIAVVLVNGFDATLKKFSKQGDFVVLEPMSTDSSFKVQIYDKNTSIQVIGKYIGKFEMSK